MLLIASMLRRKISNVLRWTNHHQYWYCQGFRRLVDYPYMRTSIPKQQLNNHDVVYRLRRWVPTTYGSLLLSFSQLGVNGETVGLPAPLPRTVSLLFRNANEGFISSTSKCQWQKPHSTAGTNRQGPILETVEMYTRPRSNAQDLEKLSNMAK